MTPDLYDTVPTRPVIVTVTCGKCGGLFDVAHLIPGAWWAEGLTPNKAAAGWVHLGCGGEPPFRIYSVRPLYERRSG